MASFNAPAPNNQIISDVNAIHELLGYLAQCRPDKGTNFPEGTLRIIEGGDNFWRIQTFDGTQWTTLKNFYLDARTLAGYQPATSATANKIPVYNASGQLVGNITGNAPTATKWATPRTIQVGGILSSTAQNIDGTTNVTIPVNQITINNSADTAVNGTLSTLHGGTGRTDGASQDVVVSGVNSSILAKSVGQIGQAKVVVNGTNIDSVIERGLYICQSNLTVEDNLPESTGGHITFMEVFHQGSFIVQMWERINRIWQRRTVNKAASWGPWYPVGGVKSDITIYISKSGSDNNTGFESSYPVLTFERAFNIADKLCGGNMESVVYFRIGAGEWGNVSITNKSYCLSLMPYDGQLPTVSSNSLPIFGDLIFKNLRVILGGILIEGLLRFDSGGLGYISEGVKRVRRLQVSANSFVQVASSTATTNKLEFGLATSTASRIQISENSVLKLGALHISLINNITADYFLHVDNSSALIVSKTYTVFDSTAATFTGAKYYLSPGSRLATGSSEYGLVSWLDTIPGTGGTIYSGTVINGMPYGAAQSNNVVDLTSEQTISGRKTFLAGSIRLKDLSFDVSTIPDSSSKFNYIYFVDKNDKSISQIINQSATTGQLISGLRLFKPNNEIAGGIYITYNRTTGACYCSCTAPEANANDAKIPTCAWVRSRIGEIDVSGAKTVSQKAYLNFSTGTASQSGTWTITGCTPNQPLFVLHNHTSSVYVSGGVRLRVKSGGTGGANGGVMSDDTTTSWYLLGHNVENQSSTDVFIAIPSAATVLIDYAGMLPNRDSLVAYQ